MGLPAVKFCFNQSSDEMGHHVRSAVSQSEDDFSGVVHVYKPFRAGLPHLGPYFREAWRRRAFASEASRAKLRSTQSDTVLGQLWNVLNHLLLAAVYFLLVTILSSRAASDPNYFSHLLCGLFAFFFIANSMTGGAKSVVKAGKMITNTAFPRMLLPLSEVRTALRKFLPTLLVLLVALVIGPVKLNVIDLVAMPWFIFLLAFATGMALLLATCQVYFRDTSNFLPYVNRIWLYASPVLWYSEQLPDRLRALEVFNPLFSILGGWSRIIIDHELPLMSETLLAAAWSFGVLILGAFVFMSRERDFAVRL